MIKKAARIPGSPSKSNSMREKKRLRKSSRRHELDKIRFERGKTSKIPICTQFACGNKTRGAKGMPKHLRPGETEKGGEKKETFVSNWTIDKQIPTGRKKRTSGS